MNSTHASGVPYLSNYQLPKRKFPMFSRVLTKWQGFEDLFKSILSHTLDLPDVERFEYLKTSLEGEALLLVSHLSLTSANYEGLGGVACSSRDQERFRSNSSRRPSGTTYCQVQ